MPTAKRDNFRNEKRERKGGRMNKWQIGRQRQADLNLYLTEVSAKLMYNKTELSGAEDKKRLAW